MRSRNWLLLALLFFVVAVGLTSFVHWHRPHLEASLRPSSTACDLPSGTPCRWFTLTVVNEGHSRATNVTCRYWVKDENGHRLAEGPMELQRVTGPDVDAGHHYVAPIAIDWLQNWGGNTRASVTCVPRPPGSSV